MEGCSKIRHIVRLRQMLRRWRMRATALSSLSRRRSVGVAPSDVPAGHVAVSVGSSSRRFVVRAVHLNHPAFRELLRQAEEEYGFPSRPGPLCLPCDESLFQDLLRLISSSSSFTDYDLEDFDNLPPLLPVVATWDGGGPLPTHCRFCTTTAFLAEKPVW